MAAKDVRIQMLHLWGVSSGRYLPRTIKMAAISTSSLRAHKHGIDMSLLLEWLGPLKREFSLRLVPSRKQKCGQFSIVLALPAYFSLCWFFLEYLRTHQLMSENEFYPYSRILLRPFVSMRAILISLIQLRLAKDFVRHGSTCGISPL